MKEFLNIEVKVITPMAFVNYDYKYHEGHSLFACLKVEEVQILLKQFKKQKNVDMMLQEFLWFQTVH